MKNHRNRNYKAMKRVKKHINEQPTSFLANGFLIIFDSFNIIFFTNFYDFSSSVVSLSYCCSNDILY